MNLNKIQELKSNNLFKIFLLISLFFILKKNKIFGMGSLVFAILYYCFNYSEDFVEINKGDSITKITVDKAIENVNPNKLRYIHNINIIRLEELCYQIVNQAKKNKKLLDTIKQKVIKIYGAINENKDLASFLKFNNLINSENLPIFINESTDVYLANEVKIILITMDKNDFENLII